MAPGYILEGCSRTTREKSSVLYHVMCCQPGTYKDCTSLGHICQQGSIPAQTCIPPPSSLLLHIDSRKCHMPWRLMDCKASCVPRVTKVATAA